VAAISLNDKSGSHCGKPMRALRGRQREPASTVLHRWRRPSEQATQPRSQFDFSFVVLFKLTRGPGAKKRARASDACRRWPGYSTVRYVQSDFHPEPKIDGSWCFPFHTKFLGVVLIVMPCPWVRDPAVPAPHQCRVASASGNASLPDLPEKTSRRALARRR